MPYTYAKNNLGYERCEKLAELLPHGSGIDYTWNIEQGSDNRYFASNSYHAMDEMGGYCHIYDFTVTYVYNVKTGKFEFTRLNFKGQREYSCCGYGLIDYLSDVLYELYL